eukprot:jgi/Tetstr1/461221/TSEL_006358.t1
MAAPAAPRIPVAPHAPVRGNCHRLVAVQIDNHNVVHIVDHGSRKTALDFLAKEVVRVRAEYGIDMVIQWVPRTENTATKDMSKYGDANDRMLNLRFCRTVSSLARLRAIASPGPPPSGASSRYASTSGMALAPFLGRSATSPATSKRGVMVTARLALAVLSNLSLSYGTRRVPRMRALSRPGRVITDGLAIAVGSSNWPACPAADTAGAALYPDVKSAALAWREAHPPRDASAAPVFPAFDWHIVHMHGPWSSRPLPKPMSN